MILYLFNINKVYLFLVFIFHFNKILSFLLENVSEFKYLGCVLDESDTDGAECSRKVASWKRVVGGIRSLINAWDLHLECASLV